MAILPKVGDPIPGSNLKYEAEDIVNLQNAPVATAPDQNELNMARAGLTPEQMAGVRAGTGYSTAPANMSIGYQNQLKGLNPDGTPILTVPTPGAGITSTSAPVVAEETKTAADVTKAWSEEPVAKSLFEQDQANLAARMKALEERRINEEAAINAQFAEKTRRTGEAQTAEKGTFTSTLARIGGYLGESASATGAMVNLNQQHQYQLNDLESKRASAVQEAKNAIDDKQFDLARLKSNEAKDYVKEIARSKQEFFSNAMAITQEGRQQDEYSRKAIKDKLDNLAYVSPDKISPETKSEIDGFYGTPGFTDNYIAVTNQAANAKTQKDLMDARKATLDFLQNIPAGQKISMPDGTEFTGMGKAGDVATFMLKDSSNRNILVTYNKLTGETGYSDTGVTGSSTNGSGVSASRIPEPAKQEVYATFQKTLDNSALKNESGKATSYNPESYIQLRDNLLGTSFAALVPILDSRYLNPKNMFFDTDGIARLRKNGIYYSEDTISNTNETAPTVNLDGDIQTGQ